MKKILCLVLTLVMLCAALSGCGGKDKLQGSWQYKLDIAPMLKEALYLDQLGIDMNLGALELPVQLTFRDDGTFCVEMGYQKVVDLVTQLVEKAQKELMDTLQAQLDEKLSGVNMGDLLGSSGLETGDLTAGLTQKLENENLVEKITGKISLEGYYQVKGDKLLLTDSQDAQLEDTYIVFSIADGLLTLSEQVGENGFIQNHPVLSDLPVTLSKTLFSLG